MIFQLSFLNGRILQCTSSFIVTIGIFGFGLAHLWPSPAIPKLLFEHEDGVIQITTEQASWIASIEMITIPFASFGTIFLANRFGTKNILLIASIPVIISWLLIIFAKNVAFYYVARCLVGFSEAFFYNCAPLYIAEISNPIIRGRLMGFVPIMFNLGGFVVFYFGYLATIRLFAIISIIPSVLYLILFIRMPQSPYYYIATGKQNEAKYTLEILGNQSISNNDFDILKNKVENDLANQGTLTQLLKDAVSRKALSTVVVLMLLQNFIGYGTITTYLHFILKQSNANVEIGALGVSVITLVSSLFATYFIDTKGRRPLLLTSVITSTICISMVAVLSFLREVYDNDLNGYLGWLVSLSLMFYIFSLNLGIVNMPFLLAGELFPINLKNYGVSFVLITYGAGGFLTNKIFQILSDNNSMSYIFMSFGVCGFLGAFYVYYCLPETRHKTLFEIQEMLKYGINYQNKNNRIEKDQTVEGEIY